MNPEIIRNTPNSPWAGLDTPASSPGSSNSHQSNRGSPFCRLLRRRFDWGLSFLTFSLFVLIGSLASVHLFASVTASISGTISDIQGAVLTNVTVEARNADTGVTEITQTDSSGFYSFPALAIGNYSLSFRKTGFEQYREISLVLQVNAQRRVDAVLKVGAVTEQVSVTAAEDQVNTTSAQLGEVVSGEHMVSMPLDGRSYTDLIALQPGVSPISSGQYYGAYNPSGDLNTGALSISGGRENFNGYMVNGATVEEGSWDTPAVVPNLDSIAEFRILTNNTDAEYGNYSGGLVNVATKSGTNQFHGDLFEFVRNTDFDARSYNSPDRGVYHQNQFGGTVGGPIHRDRMFFFADYQGTRQVIGVNTGDIAVPSVDDRTGNLSDQAASMTGSVVQGPYWASVLSNQLGYTVTQGEPYYWGVPSSSNNCTQTTGPTACVFPNAQIPQRAWASPAAHLLPYIPPPNVPGGYYSTSAYPEPLTDDKGGMRLDGKSRLGLLSAYYMYDAFNTTNPYGGGSFPGFSSPGKGRTQLLVLNDTKSIGKSALNQFNLSYLRDWDNLGDPAGGVGPTLASLGFAAPSSNGIYAAAPELQGLPSFYMNNYVFGTAGYSNIQYSNTYQVQDDFSKVVGTHSLKFGVNDHYDQIDLSQNFVISNGAFAFNGAETGSDFADLLIGAPVAFYQGTPDALTMRNYYFGAYGEDSWRTRHNLTVNLGVRWELLPFWYDTKNRLPTFIAGEQSQLFPGAPTGLVWPGDHGVALRLAPTRFGNVAPRIGIAYAPDADSGFLHMIFGNSKASSLRVGYGIYYTAVEGHMASASLGASPYGLWYAMPQPPLFSQPYIVRSTGLVVGQKFPVPAFPSHVSATNPDTNVDWSQFEPLAFSAPGPNSNNPYVESYDVSFQRQIGRSAILTLSYVGSQGHRLVSAIDVNNGNAAQCLSVSQISQVMPGTGTCGPFGESGVYYPATGGVINSTLHPYGINFAGDAYFTTIGHSSYNALEVSLHRSGKRLDLMAGYTFSKSMDDSSSYTDQINPFNPRLSTGLSAFDLTNNVVISYGYELPFDQITRIRNRFTQDWRVSGITHMASGVPITIAETDDRSLVGTCDAGQIGLCIDEPTFTPGKLINDKNPRHGNPYFNTSLYSLEPLGQVGNSRRRFFHGPGMDNYDMALLKDLRFNESRSLEFRAEFFNVFNHAQFWGASSVNGNINSSQFGYVTNNSGPRIGQLAMKLNF